MKRLTAPTLAATHSSGLVLDVKGSRITLDAGQAPYASATLTCAAPDGTTLQSVDPRKRQRVTIVLNDRADLFGQPATSRTLDLVLRQRTADAESGELTLTAYSDEAVLIDNALLAKTSKDWGTTSARALTAAVLNYWGFTLAAGSLDFTIDAAAAQQAPGQSYWDFLDGTLQAGGARLWCDERRVWRLEDKNTVQAGQLSLSYLDTMTGLSDAIGNDENFMDSLVVRYSYTDAGGNQQTAYDYAASSSTPVRSGMVEFSTRPAVAGAARRLLRRMKGRGRSLDQEAVSRFDPVPGQSFTATLPDGAPVQSGLLQSVQWDTPADRMSVTTRELSDTVGTMWAAQAAGVSWQSIPAGVPWVRYLALPWSSVAAGESWQSEPAGLRWQEYGGT